LLPSGTIDGINDEDVKYIGLGHLRNSYESFKTEQEQLVGLGTQMDVVKGKNLDILAEGTV